MVVEEITITLSGGAPWGFRLQGGVEHQRPLQVAKVRKRSKACRAGLREGDELMSINERSCEHMSHAQAMNFIDSIPGSLHIRIKRAPAGFQSVILVARAPSPRIDKEYRAALRAKSPPSFKVQTGVGQACYSAQLSQSTRSGVTSPLGSEAYYGETDSDADVAAHGRQRKQKRRSPNNSPGRAGYTSSEMGEASEMSGYDSATDVQDCTGIGYSSQEGVVRREVVYQPHPSGAWSSQTSTETSSISADEQSSSQDLVLDENNGFQELANVPLVAPERAKGALRLGVHGQLVPMVGPVDKPVDEELTKTYMDKAKQAKLNRGDTQQDKQVKEARKKCRTIASLLTDAPNPHSKGVLMFKKRRQRSKKYTLTSYGSVDEDMQQDSQEEDSQLLGSESEVDEEGFSAAPDPIWDSDYLEILEKRSSRDLDGSEAEDSMSTGLSDTTGKGAKLFKQQRKRAEEHAKKISTAPSQQSLMPSQAQLEIQTQEEHTHPTDSSVRVKKQVRLQPPPVAPKPTKSQDLRLQEEACATKTQITESLVQVTPSNVTEPGPVYTSMPVTNQPVTAALPSMSPPTAPLPELPASSVLNRTARPFAPGFISHRSATAPVVFRPNTAKKSPRPVSVAAPSFSAPSNEKVKDVPSARFTARQMNDVVTSELPSNSAPVPSKPLVYTVPEPTTAITSHPSLSGENIWLPPITQTLVPDSSVSTSVNTDTLVAGLTGPSTITSNPSAQFIAPESPMIPVAPMTSDVPKTTVNPMRCLSPVVQQENSTQVSLVTGGKTGILHEVRRRNTNKPMFKVVENKKNSPNPELLSMVQNLDDRHKQPYTESVYSAQDSDHLDDRRGRMAPPVAPKPRVMPEMSLIPRAEGKGAELFARRQNRRDLFVIGSPTSGSQQQTQQQYTEPQSSINIINSSESSSWKYSPNVRAPPPIGYNPLLSPACPPVLNRGGTRSSDRNAKVGKSVHGIQKEGIRAIDFMRRQPYQLNSAMFQFGGDSSTQTAGSSYQRQPQAGYTLSQPRQVPVKAARVYEIKRFSTPTPMSAPTINPTVIAPRSQTTLAEPLCRSDMTSPPQAPVSPLPQSIPGTTAMSARAPGLPDLPKISATPIFQPTPYSPPASLSSMSNLSSRGLQAIKQFKSAPELCLPPVPVKPTVQAPKPRFIATRVGIQPHVWTPGAL